MPDYITDNMTQLMDAPALSLSSKTLDPTFPSVVEKVIIIIERFIVIPTALPSRSDLLTPRSPSSFRGTGGVTFVGHEDRWRHQEERTDIPSLQRDSDAVQLNDFLCLHFRPQYPS